MRIAEELADEDAPSRACVPAERVEASVARHPAIEVEAAALREAKHDNRRDRLSVRNDIREKLQLRQRASGLDDDGRTVA